MRLLALQTHLARVPRLSRALTGLVRRGHLLGVVGGGPWPGALAVEARDVPSRTWDVVIGAGDPGPIAALGRRSAARAMVVAADARTLSRGDWGHRMAWDALTSLVLIDEADATLAREGPHGVALERFALWPAGLAAIDADPVSVADTEVLERAAERALTRSAGPGLRAALFVDRDGTLIEERGYLADPIGVVLLPGVAQSLREVRAAGHPVVVVSNQAGIGRGRFTLAQAHSVMAEMRQQLRRHGVELDAVHFCPHSPDAGCRCRKPGTLLFERAAADLQIHLPHSFMVGDKRLDAEAGRQAGMVGAIVATGYAGQEEGDRSLPDAVPRHADLQSAVRWFLDREEARVIQ